MKNKKSPSEVENTYIEVPIFHLVEVRCATDY